MPSWAKSPVGSDCQKEKARETWASPSPSDPSSKTSDYWFGHDGCWQLSLHGDFSKFKAATSYVTHTNPAPWNSPVEKLGEMQQETQEGQGETSKSKLLDAGN